MFVVFAVMVSLGPDEWVAVEAKVLGTSIISQQYGGPPEWALIANFSYRAANNDYAENSHEIFSSPDWEEVKAQQKKWPPGRTMTVYHHPDNPGLTSPVLDGGRETRAVLAAMMTPVVIFLFVLLTYLVRKRLQLK